VQTSASRGGCVFGPILMVNVNNEMTYVIHKGYGRDKYWLHLKRTVVVRSDFWMPKMKMKAKLMIVVPSLLESC
jgi:hypothetical protein